MTRNFMFFLAVLWCLAFGFYGAIVAPIGVLMGFIGGTAMGVLLLGLLLTVYVGCSLVQEMLQ